MKKKQLRLDKETLRNLQPGELSLAVGGSHISNLWCSRPCPPTDRRGTC
jgi:hypothetical protein